MSTVLSWARLSFRLQRPDILLLTAAVLVASGLMAWSAFQLEGLASTYPDCDFFDPSVSCQAAGQSFESVFGMGELIFTFTGLVGSGVGLLLGVSLVAREVEQGTAQLAWTIGRSRVRWLIGRVAFAALVGIALLGPFAVMTDVLAAAMRPEIDTSQAFWGYGKRGPMIVGQGMLGLGAGLLVGALLGKQLPALLLAVLAVGGLSLASNVGFPSWYQSEAVVASTNELVGEPMGISSGVQLMSGERVPYSAAGAEWGDENGALYTNEADFQARRNPIGYEYQLIIPGERYPEIVARETAVFTGAGLLLIGGAAAVTRRRRPS
jgi:hypothetical protein